MWAAKDLDSLPRHETHKEGRNEWRPVGEDFVVPQLSELQSDSTHRRRFPASTWSKLHKTSVGGIALRENISKRHAHAHKDFIGLHAKCCAQFAKVNPPAPSRHPFMHLGIHLGCSQMARLEFVLPGLETTLGAGSVNTLRTAGSRAPTHTPCCLHSTAKTASQAYMADCLLLVVVGFF